MIGDKITIVVLAIKYWCQGEDWRDALIIARNLVEEMWR